MFYVFKPLILVLPGNRPSVNKLLLSNKNLTGTWCPWLNSTSEPIYIWVWWKPCAFVKSMRKWPLFYYQTSYKGEETFVAWLHENKGLCFLCRLRRNFCLLGYQEYPGLSPFPKHWNAIPPSIFFPFSSLLWCSLIIWRGQTKTPAQEMWLLIAYIENGIPYGYRWI